MISYQDVHSIRLAKTIATVDKLQPSTILELGCYPPEALLLSLRQRYQVFGICSDFEPVNLPDVAKLNIESDPFPFPANSLDLVLLCEVIEHMTQHPPTHLLTQIHQVLRPGGHLLITTPNQTQLKNLARRLFRLAPPAGHDSTYSAHHHEYTLAELGSTLTHHGFTVTQAQHIDFYTPFRTRSRYDHLVLRSLKILAYCLTSLIPPIRDSLLVIAQKPTSNP